MFFFFAFLALTAPGAAGTHVEAKKFREPTRNEMQEKRRDRTGRRKEMKETHSNKETSRLEFLAEFRNKGFENGKKLSCIEVV